MKILSLSICLESLENIKIKLIFINACVLKEALFMPLSCISRLGTELKETEDLFRKKIVSLEYFHVLCCDFRFS